MGLVPGSPVPVEIDPHAVAQPLTTPQAAEGPVRRHNTAMPERGRTGLIGALVPVVYDLYFSAIVSGLA